MMHKFCVAMLSLLSAATVLAGYPTGSGPQPAMAYSDTAFPSHTIYRPQRLQGTYPVVLWGNGSCVNSNFGYREFLAQVASHGFIVVAIGPYRDSPAPRQERPANPADWPPDETNAQQLLDGLDWITAENSRNGSQFQGHVNTGRVAVMGHSCGGMQSLKVSTDPRISTTLILNSGMFPDGDAYMERFDLQRSQLDELHAPIAYFIGGETDIAYVNAESDFNDLQQRNIPAINANMDVGHGATYHLPDGGPFGRGPLSWLQWQLLDDSEAAASFVGANCGLCVDNNWVLRRHNIP